MPDKQILELLRKGDHHKVLENLYKGYLPIKQFIQKHGGSEDDVKDVFQEALIIFYQKAVKPEFQLTSKISTYLYSTCRYIWKDRLKQKNMFVSHDDFSFTDVENYTVENTEENRSLDRILIQLSDKCQSVLEGYYILKMSMKEIADSFGYSSVGSAKNQKYKCLEKAKTLAKQELLNHSKLAQS